MAGRKPLPPGQARTVKLYTKVTEAGDEAFRERCQQENITPAEGLRRAVAEWTNRRRR